MAKKGETKILGIITICIMLVSIGLSGCVGDGGEENDYSKGDLKLEISMEKEIFKTNESIILTISLINNGRNKLRVEKLIYLINLKVYITNSINIQYYSEEDAECPEDLDDSDYTILKPEENITFNQCYLNYYRDLNPNNNTILGKTPDEYQVYAKYETFYPNKNPKSNKEHWMGIITSNIIYFDVTN